MRKWVSALLGIGMGLGALTAALDQKKPESPLDQARYIQVVARFQDNSRRIWQYLNEGKIARAALEAQVNNSLLEAQLGASDTLTKDAEALALALKIGAAIDSNLTFIANRINEYGDINPSAVRTMETELFPELDAYFHVVSDFDGESRARIEAHFLDRLKVIKFGLTHESEKSYSSYTILLQRFNQRMSQMVIRL